MFGALFLVLFGSIYLEEIQYYTKNLGLISEDGNAGQNIFDITQFKPAWENLSGGSFKFDCE